MANFGVRDLRLVAPEADPADPRAIALATHGAEVLAQARRFGDLHAATADCVRAWGTAAVTRARPRRVLHPRGLAALTLLEEGRHALVFGPERTGLDDAALDLLDGVVQIPTDPSCRALNLAQAVGILCWECAAAEVPAAPLDRPPAPAGRDAFEGWWNVVTARIDASGWLTDPTLRTKALATLRGAFQRAGFTQGELRSLHGFVRALGRDT
jgi:tRNA/rRNA methyltransferase